MDQKMQILDWIVLGAYALGMLTVGWYFSRKTKTSEDYMLGGRKMKPWTVGLSFFATLFSAISYLAVPGETIKYGPMMLCRLAAYPLIFLVVGWFLIPRIMKLKISSAHELLEVRLGPSLRILASLLFLAMRLIWMSVIIYMCAVKVIVPIMGWSEDAALWVSIVMGIITVIYTSMGGLRAVVLTDTVQTFVLFGAAILSIILIGRELGGLGAFLPAARPDSWIEWKFFDTNPGARVSFLSVSLSTFCWWVFTAGSDQMAIQRYLATRNTKAARQVLRTSIVCDILVAVLLTILGFGLLGYFHANQHLLPRGEAITDCADKLFPHFIVIGLPVGITGLVIAGLLAAAMSSLSSGVNSACLTISKDFISRFRKKKISESAQIKLAKVVSLAVGVVVVLLSLVVCNIKGNLLELTFKTCNLLTAPLFVPFFMALFVRRATEFGTFVGTLASVTVAVMVSFSTEIFARPISFLWIMPVSFVAGVLVSTLLSLLWPNKRNRLGGE